MVSNKAATTLSNRVLNKRGGKPSVKSKICAYFALISSVGGVYGKASVGSTTDSTE